MPLRHRWDGVFGTERLCADDNAGALSSVGLVGAFWFMEDMEIPLILLFPSVCFGSCDLLPALTEPLNVYMDGQLIAVMMGSCSAETTDFRHLAMRSFLLGKEAGPVVSACPFPPASHRTLNASLESNISTSNPQSMHRYTYVTNILGSKKPRPSIISWITTIREHLRHLNPRLTIPRHSNHLLISHLSIRNRQTRDLAKNCDPFSPAAHGTGSQVRFPRSHL